MLQVLEFAANGLALGAIYALVSMAITVIWATSEVLDISSGAQATFAGVVAAAVGMPWGPVAGVAAGMFTGAAIAGVFQMFHLRVLKDPVPIILSTFAILIIIESAILTVVGPEGVKLTAVVGVVEVGGAIILISSLVAIGCATASLVVVALLLRFTPIGLNMRASAISEKSARLVGIAVRQTQTFAFVLGGVLVGIAGVVAAMLVGLSYSSPFSLTLAGLGGALLFGRKTPQAAFLGGMLIGLAETLGQAYLPSGWSAGTSSLVILLVLATSRNAAIAFSGARP
ncbi:branched-chain amino acid ABC transporter permease [Nitrobacteraceae bacterium UC4446_H13]